MPWVEVTGVPDWIDHGRLLDDSGWERTAEGAWSARRDARAAADLQARLRNLVLGGSSVQVSVRPSLKRTLVRSARTDDARRRRDTSPGFRHPQARLDEEGRYSLTPEDLALRMGERAGAISVLDATGGCGGNAIGFARAGASVTLVEIDGSRLAMARHNAALYGVSDRIRFVHGDALEVLHRSTPDLLFLDPPWADGVPLLDCLLAVADAPAIWLKLPPGHPLIDGYTPEAWFGTAPGDRQRVKFLLLRK